MNNCCEQSVNSFYNDHFLNELGFISVNMMATSSIYPAVISLYLWLFY